MYRKPASPEPDATAPPRQLVYSATDRGRRGSSAVAMFQFFSAPVIVAVALTMTIGPNAGLVGLIASAIAAVWWWRRAPNAGGVVLRVEGGALLVLSGKREKARFALDALDVEMDTKTIKKMQEGSSAIPAMRFIDATVGPELDTARVVVIGSGQRLPLTTDYVAHMDASEWFGKIRVFLRKNGWTPVDEREPVSSSDEANDSER